MQAVSLPAEPQGKWYIINIICVQSGLPRQLFGEESACQCRDVSSVPGSDSLEQEMASHSSILAWAIPWTEEPGGLQSISLQRFRHDLATEQQQSSVQSVLNILKISKKLCVLNFYFRGIIS